MDYERALKVVEDYLAQIREYDRTHRVWLNTQGQLSVQARQQRDAISDELGTRLPLIVRIGEQIYPGDFAGRMTYSANPNARFDTIKTHVLHLRGALRDSAEAAEIIGTTGPRIAAADLHPTVWSAAARLWADGHPRQAVESAATAIDDALRGKLERSDIRGSALIEQAFSKEDPEPGKPRLRFDIDPRDENKWNDAHIGCDAVRQGLHDADSQRHRSQSRRHRPAGRAGAVGGAERPRSMDRCCHGRTGDLTLAHPSGA